MKKYLFFVATLFVLTAFAQKKPATGSGTSDAPYEISNADELFWFAGLVNGTLTDGTPRSITACAVLTSDIAVNQNGLSVDEEGNPLYNGRPITELYAPREWTPIGEITKADVASGNYNKYSGTFDGNGHKISGIYINTNTNYQGFFGYAYRGSMIKNVSIVESYIKGGGYVGSIAGRTEGSILGCHNSSVVTSMGYGVGGICGSNAKGNVENCQNVGNISSINGLSCNSIGGICGSNSGIIKRCHNSGNVIAKSQLGGICGVNYQLVLECYNEGNIINTDYEYSYIGGVVGDNSGNITSCFNLGEVTGKSNTGGICGRNFNADSSVNPTVKDCYNIGKIKGAEQVGGICGYQYLATLKDCYNVGGITASGSKQIGGVCGEMSGNDITISNCYYLNTAASGGINGLDRTGSAEPLTALNFLLSNMGFDTQVWNQILPNKQETDEGFVYHLPYLTGATPCTLYPVIDDYGQPGTVVGISRTFADPEFSVYSSGGTICIFGSDAKVEISDVSGFFRAMTFARVISVPRGIYFVKIGNCVEKVVVE